MSRLLLISRLVVRDLRNRPSEALLLLLAIVAATATLTLSLVLHGVTTGPYERTRATTAGPDLVARSNPPVGSSRPADPAALLTLATAPGITAHSGPFPVTWAALYGGGHTAAAMIEGRDESPSSVDRPMLTAGSWVHPGAVVLERGFADALGAGPGSEITLGGREFVVAGTAVSAAVPTFPAACSMQAHTYGCDNGPSLPHTPRGLVWTTTADANSLATAKEPVGWLLNLNLADPNSAPAFASSFNKTHTGLSAPVLVPWQRIATGDAQQVSEQQQILLVGSWLLGLLAIASVALLAGGRMAGQIRRVALLKAVGATPGFVTVVLLAEHLVVAVTGAAAGLTVGRLAAPSFVSPSAGLLGAPAPPTLTLTVAAIVVASALALSAAATLVPALRGALTDTASALAAAVRPPKRHGLIAHASARMPTTILLGMRIAARRPRRTLLSASSWSATVAGIVSVLMTHAQFTTFAQASGNLTNPLYNGISQVVTVLTAALVTLAAVNALLITWATMLDTKRSSALTRALGASALQVSGGLAVAQMLPAAAAAVTGLPTGIAMYVLVRGGGTVSYPIWWLAATVIATPLAVGALTMIPTRLAARPQIATALAGPQ